MLFAINQKNDFVMQAKELMFYDWVLYNGKPYKVEDFYTASGFGRLGLIALTRDEKGDGYNTYEPVYDKNVNPLPITPEIMEKNRMKKIIEKDKDYLFGCVSVSYRYQPYGESDPVHELTAEDEELYESVDDYMKSTCRGYMFTVVGNNGLVKDARVTKYIRYVHELQHILRVCGLDKLANNFKI